MTTASILGSCWQKTAGIKPVTEPWTGSNILIKGTPTCSTVQGGPRYLLGPMNWTGEALWLKIGSVRTFSPSISTRTVAWPSQVTLRPGPDSDRSGFWTKYGSRTGSSLSKTCRGEKEEKNDEPWFKLQINMACGHQSRLLFLGKLCFCSYEPIYWRSFLHVGYWRSVAIFYS